jgi:DNA-binding SARP family transcriptional activator
VFELSVFADPVELHWSGTRIPLRPKERLLLCRLAFAKGSSVPARQLVAELRDAGPRDAAADTLRSHVSHLRGGIARVAGELGTGLLTTERDAQGAVYRLNLDPESVDAIRFGRLVGAGNDLLACGQSSAAGERFEEALRLWRGEPLRDAADWPFARRVRAGLAERRRAAVMGLVQIRLAEGRHREVISELRELADRFRADGEAWELLVHCLWRDGRDSEAAATCRRVIEAFHSQALDVTRLAMLQRQVLTGVLPR